MPEALSAAAPAATRLRLSQALYNGGRLICDVRPTALPRSAKPPKNAMARDIFVLLRLGRITSRSAPNVASWSEHLLAASVKSMQPRTRPVCDALVVQMDNAEADAAARAAIQQDVVALLSLTRESPHIPLIVMHGPERCAPPQRYNTGGQFMNQPERCWIARWTRLLYAGDVREPSCMLGTRPTVQGTPRS